MNIVNISSILSEMFSGKKISKQPGIPENFWGKTIQDITPCDLDYGCDCGYNILVEGNQLLTIRFNQELGID